jgi:hypothetical protein
MPAFGAPEQKLAAYINIFKTTVTPFRLPFLLGTVTNTIIIYIGDLIVMEIATTAFSLISA